MENNIEKIIVLEDDSKYMIIDQGNYNGKAYYFLSKLDSEDNLTNTVSIVENDNGNIVSVKDEKLLVSFMPFLQNFRRDFRASRLQRCGRYT